MKNNVQPEFLAKLATRFQTNMHRHPHLKWSDVENKLRSDEEKLYIVSMMEDSGGEPDVVEWDNDKSQITFVDCSVESPSGRRSLCYDREALEKRKEHKPKNSAMDVANEMGIDLLTEEEYRFLQKLEKLDLKTSSWIKTPENIRDLGGALFCDRRYDTVFTYHNGADSYYAARGFRGKLIL